MIVAKSEKQFREALHDADISENYGDWRFTDITNLSLRIELGFFIPFIAGEKIIKFSDIAWKGMNLPLTMRRENCICCDGFKYRNCDESFSGILLKHAPNPFNLKYRMIDGKHRMEKLLLQGKTKSSFRIVEYKKIKPKLKSILEQIGGNSSDSF